MDNGVCDWPFRQESLIVLTPASMTARDPHAILRTEPFIRLEHKTCVGQLIDGYLRRAGIRSHERYGLDSLEQLQPWSTGTWAWHRCMGTAMAGKGLSLRKLPVRDASFTKHLGPLWTRASLRLRLVQAFLEAAAT